ncbi:hypothetical protein OIDMADRAFT_35968 [Oidiodendron maius Zn]|uniref:Transcription factor CBF/NF-Y/archaeal histone domain-containing protein n=1 Tax=Oidiodendron maius (strain Zn) TaxID=913774 RepID=A0A0C3GRU9_OIDMZ|nr:hypothetical protein OIDMADRAFT_35968 [Oidiodendron maius Zn]
MPCCHELFIQYLAQQGQSVVKSEQKPHQNIQYRDLSSAVAYHDNLKFLADVIPRTVPFKQVDGESKPGLARRPLIGAPCMVDDIDDGAAADPNTQQEESEPRPEWVVRF